MIKIRNLHKYFNKGRENEIHVINDVTLSLPERGIVAIFGRSGCGKTTLLNVIGGLDTYRSGSVEAFGREISSDIDTYRNRDIGYIFQNYNLLKDESCYDNVANALRLCGMDDKKEIRRRVDTALSFVDMAQYGARTPDTLSGGQQQRVAIARAIVKNPCIILADEPTGNLDEVNTVMVMDLLREISKDCLVLLVTHEAELVDYYCDAVIELSDGRVASQRENHIADGYAVRDKNTIYLGELEKEALASEAVSIAYYGQKPDQPIEIKVVNYGGKTYLSVLSPNVQLLDADSETKLSDGVFERREEVKKKESSIDMTRLPRVQGKRFGSLFSLKSAVVSGYRANFTKNKKRKNMLRASLALFAAVIVFMTAIFGTAIGQLESMRNANSQNVFYALSDDALASLLQDPDTQKENGIDALYLGEYYVGGDHYMSFRTNYFETFETGYFESDFTTHGVYLPSTLIEKAPLIVGTKTLGENELILSSASADILLDASTMSYIAEYEDLLGLLSDMYSILGSPYRIVGIVESDEPAFYLDPLALAKETMRARSNTLVPASKIGVTVKNGSLLYYTQYNDDPYTVGGTAKIFGKNFTVTSLLTDMGYEAYAEKMGIKLPSQDRFMEEKIKTVYPDADPADADYGEKWAEIYETYLSEWYVTYFSHLEAYCRQTMTFSPDFAKWLFVEKGIWQLYYSQSYYELYRIRCYFEKYGELPTVSEMGSYTPPTPDEYEAYVREFEKKEHRYYERAFVVSDEDFLKLCAAVGESGRYVENDYYGKNEELPEGVYPNRYVIHSYDPDKTLAFLRAHLPSGVTERNALISPESLFEEAMAMEYAFLMGGFVAMGVLLAVMSVCMYFMMRAALMSRIREIGIYRAIGVSKKNLLFRFAVESGVLFTLTVFVGYLLSSAFIGLCLSASSLVASIFYYPLWLAAAVLLILFLICMLCGMIPIFSLLRRSPSAILAKYDI